MIIKLMNPANVSFVISVLLMLVNAELIDPDWTTAYIYDFELDEEF